MKLVGICAILALAALGAAPVMAAGPMADKAAALAAPGSEAALSDICNAVFEAVKEDPEKADEVIARVVGQRKNWTAGQVYAILRALLLARPELEAGFMSHAENCPICETIQGREGAAPAGVAEPMVCRVLSALHGASLADGVLASVMNALANNTVDLAIRNEGVIRGHSGTGTTPALTPPGAEIPTPGPMSPQN